MRKSQPPLSATIVDVIATLGLWAAVLIGMAALPDGASVATARVAEPTGVLISQQDKSGQTAYFRELRASVPTARTAPGSNGDSC